MMRKPNAVRETIAGGSIMTTRRFVPGSGVMSRFPGEVTVEVSVMSEAVALERLSCALSVLGVQGVAQLVYGAALEAVRVKREQDNGTPRVGTVVHGAIDGEYRIDRVIGRDPSSQQWYVSDIEGVRHLIYRHVSDSSWHEVYGIPTVGSISCSRSFVPNDGATFNTGDSANYPPISPSGLLGEEDNGDA